MRVRKTSITEEDILTTAKRFDLMPATLCIMLYHLCNGNNIEPTTMSNFINWLNLKDTNPQVSPLLGEKTRCCYLFREVSEHIINKQYKEQWISMMLKRTGISMSHFKSHTYEVGLDKSNEKDMMLIKGIPEAVEKAKCYSEALKSSGTYIF